MQTPYRLTLTEWTAIRALWLDKNTLQAEDQAATRTCRKHAEPILNARREIPIHQHTHGPCADTGVNINVTVPYCPTCQESPSSTGCLHFYSGLDGQPRLY